MIRRLAALVVILAAGAAAQDDVLLRAMRDEIARSKALSVVGGEQPYYIEYAAFAGESVTASATLGALLQANRTRYRLPQVQVRVGDYRFDNTNWLGTDFYAGARYDTDQLPLDDSYPVLRRYLWLATDVAYKAALDAIARKRAALRNITLSDELPDFARSEPRQAVLEIAPVPVDLEAWSARVKNLSAVFLKYPSVFNSLVDFDAGQSAQYLVNSEGARVRVPERMAFVRVRGSSQAADGMPLRDALMFHTLDPARWPSDAELERGVRAVAEDLTALAQAPAGEPYSGPVLFEGAAAAQLFAEVLGRNLAVPRRPVSPPGRPAPVAPSELEGRVGARILPEWMDVVDDPTQTEWRGRPLFGHYEVDLEGVPAQPVQLVSKGVLKNFLLTRDPVKGFPGSNGHGRLPGPFGHKAAGIGNLFVKAGETAAAADLRRKLLELCAARGKPYGIIVRKMDFPSSASFREARRLLAGMAQSGMSSRPVSLPVLVYRVYRDGHEELVRGLRFRGLNARSLKDIVAASDEMHVFDFLDNTAPFALMGGAGFVSEAAVVAPSILIDDLEMERAHDELPKPPLVPPPPLAGVM